jgi:hypothetical protein
MPHTLLLFFYDLEEHSIQIIVRIIYNSSHESRLRAGIQHVMADIIRPIMWCAATTNGGREDRESVVDWT